MPTLPALPQGQTLKQHGLSQFLHAAAEYQAAKAGKDTRRFIMASVRLHAAKGNPGVTRKLVRAVMKNP